MCDTALTDFSIAPQLKSFQTYSRIILNILICGFEPRNTEQFICKAEISMSVMSWVLQNSTIQLSGFRNKTTSNGWTVRSKLLTFTLYLDTFKGYYVNLMRGWRL